MSRLDSAIARLKAQRVCLGVAAEMLSELPGHVLELGLGNGRTYDHIRELMPDRKIYVFDRRIAAHPDTIPPVELTYLGEMSETLPRAARELGATAVLVHADIGGGGQAASDRNATMIAPLLPSLIREGGLVLVDQQLHCSELQALGLPDGVPERRYFMSRRI